jgi:flagellin-like protein
MKKLLKSKKALSPVVAAIILIAVTVAVSIAVAAWMGSLTIGFMETKELTVTQMAFTDGDTITTGVILVSVTNSGTSDVTVSLLKLNGATLLKDGALGNQWSCDTEPIPAGDSATITINAIVANGNKYAVTLFTSDGTMVGSYTDTA